ncbi:hypothetical protein E4U21_003289 [Claviceps maximensis]|nr:hypothetical protein E4U21_003289 [Claviceps maximensis]
MFRITRTYWYDGSWPEPSSDLDLDLDLELELELQRGTAYRYGQTFWNVFFTYNLRQAYGQQIKYCLV